MDNLVWVSTTQLKEELKRREEFDKHMTDKSHRKQHIEDFKGWLEEAGISADSNLGKELVYQTDLLMKLKTRQ